MQTFGTVLLAISMLAASVVSSPVEPSPTPVPEAAIQALQEMNSIQTCCWPDSHGTCGDGTQGTPYCGHGPCNAFGCACRGGCR